MRVLGIDEAGRGCVLGPLVVAGFLTSSDTDDALRAAGARDSKTLSATRRQEARARLEPLAPPTSARSPPARSTRATSTASKRPSSST